MDAREAIREALRSGEISQSELARRSGRSQGTIWAIQHARGGQTYDTIKEVHAALSAFRAENPEPSTAAGESPAQKGAA